jgi:hypothetical protein
MIGAISNPKKEISFPKGISEVKKALGDLQTYLIKVGADNYQTESYDEFIGELKLSSFEFLSLGVYIIFNVKKQDEENTIINIEVQRKIGAFDEAHEVGNANRHLNYLTNVLSSLLRNPSMDLGIAMGHSIIRQPSAPKGPTPGWAIFWLILFWPYGLYYMWKNDIWSQTTKYVITGIFLLSFISVFIK